LRAFLRGRPSGLPGIVDFFWGEQGVFLLVNFFRNWILLNGIALKMDFSKTRPMDGRQFAWEVYLPFRKGFALANHFQRHIGAIHITFDYIEGIS